MCSLLGGWLMAFSLCIPPLFHVAPYRYDADLAACVPYFQRTGSLWYAIVFTITTFIIPGALIIGCNIRVCIDFMFLFQNVMHNEIMISNSAINRSYVT